MLIQADARSLPLRDGCVDCVVTSPPYWGLRDYGSVHQIGLEASIGDYVASLVAVFREVRRVLKASGTVWLNLGDSYSSSGGLTAAHGVNAQCGNTLRQLVPRDQSGPRNMADLAPKNLIGVPWRVAFALQAEGWYLRSDVVWSKPNPMPESVEDRPTRAHEFLFLLAPNEHYYYDKAAICEPYQAATLKRGRSIRQVSADGHQMSRFNGEPLDAESIDLGRNARSVWHIAAAPFRGAHFATMPEKLVEPCILAGCPMGGLVLDPFSGSGTVLAVAERLSRRGVGVDLNPAYHQLAKERTRQRGLRFDEAVNE